MSQGTEIMVKLPVRLIIAGSRDFNDYKLLEKEVVSFMGDKCPTIVSGCANGADTLGEQLAEKFRLKLIKIPANWRKYGKSAGYRRNVEMAKISSHCIVFWDGKSRGSKHMIDIATEYKLDLKVVQYG